MQVLQALGAKGHIQTQTVTEIEELLKDRDITSTEHALPSPRPVNAELNPVPRSVPQQKVDRKVAEQRIEEDRERHKRLRENIWAIPTPSDEKRETDILWENTSNIGEDDFLLYREEGDERALCGKNWEEDFLRNNSDTISIA